MNLRNIKKTSLTSTGNGFKMSTLWISIKKRHMTFSSEALVPNCDPTGKSGQWSKGCIEKFDHLSCGKMTSPINEVLNK